MRIFLGTEEIASVLSGLNEGFRRLGHDTTTYVSQKNIYYNVAYDIEKGTPVNNLLHYNSRKYPAFFKYVGVKIDARITPFWLNLQTESLIRDHDLFVFIWRPWIPEWKLFRRIKAAGKKIICVHLGSDVRDAAAYQQEFNVDVSKWDDRYHEDLNTKIKKIRYQELFADSIYSIPDQAGLMLRPYKHIFLPLSTEKNIEFHIPAREIPVILHAPTNSSIKGTDQILAALEQLRTEGHEFELKLIRNLPNHELLRELTNADILVDELVLHGPGVLSFEAMAAGCAVATKTLNTHKSIYDPPVCSIHEGNLKENLRKLLQNKQYRIELAEKGQKFVIEKNDPAVIAGNMLRDIVELSPDYFPSFYVNHYTLPNGTSLTKENKRLSKLIFLRTIHLKDADVKRAIAAGLMDPIDENEMIPTRALDIT